MEFFLLKAPEASFRLALDSGGIEMKYDICIGYKY